MCGIAGIYRTHGSGDDEAVVRRMLARLERRGPDDEGLASEPRAVLGNRRLAILDLSQAGHQPMASADGRLVVTLNGEIYNYRELAREMGLGPGQLRSASDTEVALHAWQRWGAEALQRFVGQWACAVYDRMSHHLWLARDRFGEKPLFHHADPDRVAFASSLEALLEDRSIARALDPGALAEYMTLRYVVAPRTVFRGVRKLEGGRLLEVSPDGSVCERTWYVPPFRRHPGPAPGRRESAERFGALLGRSVERCLVSDRPVGLLLSDGIDSNALLSAMPDPDGHVTCFTFRLRDDDRGDVPAPMIAPGRNLVDIHASRDEMLGDFDAFCADMTEPVGDVAALATWTIIRSARSRATVFLCGHGGDEILGGYRLNRDLFRLGLLRRASALPRSWIAGALRRYVNGAESQETLRGALRHATAEEAPAAARYLIDRPCPPARLRDLFGGALPAGETYLATVDRLYRECPSDAAALDRVQLVLARTFLAANILSWADSVAMSSSAELRMPYLDRDLVEFMARLPSGHRVPAWPGRSNTKRVLRDWARSRVPAEVLNRPKKGFKAGSVEALLRAVRGGARERVLGSTALRAALPGLEAWLRAIPDDYTGGTSGFLWSLLVLASWCEARGLA